MESKNSDFTTSNQPRTCTYSNWTILKKSPEDAVANHEASEHCCNHMQAYTTEFHVRGKSLMSR